MRSVTLLLGIHNHQPVGNFEHVFRAAYERCYRPFLDVLERHPTIRVTLHYTGPLLSWFDKEEPDFLERIKRLVHADQVEMLGGGFYEPILSVIPDRDAVGQLNLMSEWLRARIGADPQGLWLAERVWDAGLPKKLMPAGLRYTILDDSHFLQAGLDSQSLAGYYLTEREGHPLALFPISKELRYLIPFRLPEDLIAFLGRLRESESAGHSSPRNDSAGTTSDRTRPPQAVDSLQGTAMGSPDAPPPDRTRQPQAVDPLRGSAMGSPDAPLPDDIAVTYADDGEKFGLWPGTYQWVYEERYLERLFESLEQHADWIRLETFGRYLSKHAPTSRVYLPSASYEEMMEWALPADASRALLEGRAQLEKEGRLAEFRPFLRGGFWDGFLVKYPESNHMHKRMLDLSERIAKRFPNAGVSEPLELVWRAQGNDVYWHGLFGGLYLNNLRHETYRNLIAAETHLDRSIHRDAEKAWMDVRVMDLDKDGHEEVMVSTRTLGLCLAPACGGSLVELDYRPAHFNLMNVLTRRREAYHAKLAEAAVDSEAGGGPPPSIHELVKLKEPDLERALIYDAHRRLSFVDRFLDAGVDPEALDRIDDFERGNCVGAGYDLEPPRLSDRHGPCTLQLVFAAEVRVEGRVFPVHIRKSYRVTPGESALGVSYAIENQAEDPCVVRFGCELNLTLLAGNDPQRFYECPGSGRKRLQDRYQCAASPWVSFVDEWHRFRVTVELDRPADIWCGPIETVSQSEDGFERTYQGSAILASWSLTLKPRTAERLDLRLEITKL
jgi:4-alpha-glucanotransferase